MRIALLVGLMLAMGIAACDPASQYLEIRDWHDLYAINANLAGHYILMNDLDSTSAGYGELAGGEANQGRGWQPIGTSDNPFKGSLDGQGHEIRDMFINRSNEYLVGLFGTVDVDGVVRNVRISSATVTGEWAVGALVGENWGYVGNSRVLGGRVSGEDCIGGLVGRNGGAVLNCHSNAEVSGHWDVGGLVGSNESPGSVTSSYSSGRVRGEWAVGGLMGSNLGATVARCYCAGTVVGDDYVGGLVGDNQGGVSDCYSTASVVGQWYVGGLLGDNDSLGTVTQCYSSGGVSGLSCVGGLVGANRGTVRNSFWNVETSKMNESDGGTGMSTAQMNDIATYINAGWNIVSVASGLTNPAYTWNIINGQAHPFLSCQV